MNLQSSIGNVALFHLWYISLLVQSRQRHKTRASLVPAIFLAFKQDDLGLRVYKNILSTLTSSFVLHESFPWNPIQLSPKTKKLVSVESPSSSLLNQNVTSKTSGLETGSREKNSVLLVKKLTMTFFFFFPSFFPLPVFYALIC